MKVSVSKVLLVAADTVLAVYLVLALAVFDKKGTPDTRCTGVKIDIADDAVNGFIDAREIKRRLVADGIYPIGKPLESIDTRRIEDMLKASPFVESAECYKTLRGNVYVSVTQRMPVIRIKADNGDDYYVDDNDRIMPKSDYTSDLVIVSGSVSRKFATDYISALGKALMANEMWSNLIEQIHVCPDRGIEIIPRVGDHVVYIGRLPDGEKRDEREKAIAAFIDRKLTRLVKFYKYGLSQVGWNKYSYINIEFDNQIICKKKGYVPPQRHLDEEVAAQPAGQDAAKQPAATPSGEKKNEENLNKATKNKETT